MAEVEISGKLASLIETGATLVVKHMMKEFSEQLTTAGRRRRGLRVRNLQAPELS